MDLTGVNPYIYGRAESDFNSGTTIKKDLDKLDFLNLLVTQLQNQDPLDPMDDKEFVAQLAQFSSLEQLTNISSGIDGLSEAMSRQELINTASYIGKDITANGYSVSKGKDSEGKQKISEMYYEFDENVASVQINVFDSSNNIVRTETFGAMAAGRYPYNWDGKNYKGEDEPDGVYNVYVAAFDANGKSVLTSTDVSGTVKAIQHSDGVTWLALGDGRMVNFSNVKYVVDPSISSGNTGNGDTGGGDTGGGGGTEGGGTGGTGGTEGGGTGGTGGTEGGGTGGTEGGTEGTEGTNP